MKNNKNLTSVVSIFLLLTQSVAGAETFRSFEYRDANISERADIKDIYQKNSTEASPSYIAGIKKISLKDVDLFLFKEVAERYETANNPSATTWQPIAPVATCVKHKSFDFSKVVKAHRLCISARYTLKKAFQQRNFTRDCQEAYEPEMYSKDLAPGEIRISKLNTLPGLIQTIINPMSAVQFAENLVPPELLQKMRFLLTKIRMDELLQNVQRKNKLYTDAINTLNSSACFPASEADLQELKAQVQELQQETQSAENYLLQIDQEGRAQAAADKARVNALGRTRDQLPYPNLSDADREFITMYVGGIYWRLRGGGVVTQDSTQFRRIFFTWTPMKILGELNGGSDARSMGFLTFIRLFKMWGQYFDMGSDPTGNDKYWDLNKMTERGVFQVKSDVKKLDRMGYDTTALRMSGLQMGACYYFPYDQNLPRLKYVGAIDSIYPVAGSPYLSVLKGETDWGEVCTGMSIGLGMSRSLLGGYVGGNFHSQQEDE